MDEIVGKAPWPRWAQWKPVRERRSKPFAPLPPSPAEVERDRQQRSDALAAEREVLREEPDRLRRKPWGGACSLG